MPQINQRGAVQFAVLLILLAGIVGIVYLVTSGPLKIFPKAGPGVNIEFVDSQGLPVKTTTVPKVTFRINYPSETYFPEKNTSAPITLEPAAVVLSEDPRQTVNMRKYPFTGKYSVIERYTFSSSTIGKKTLYAQFIMKNGKRVNAVPYPATIELVSQTSPSPTTTPTSTPTPSVSPAPTANPTPTPITQSYKRVFVTSTTYDGNLGGLSGADTKCQERANAAQFGGTWKAWLSDSTTSASSRLLHHAGPYKLARSGLEIASSWNDLTDGSSLTRAIGEDEKGGSWYNYLVWTNTKSDGSIDGDPLAGVANGHCSNWTSINGIGNMGTVTSWSPHWTDDPSGQYRDCNVTFMHLYCFEQ